MIRKAVSVAFFALSSLVCASESDFITYDWLMDCARNTSYTDHIPHFRLLFKKMKVRTFLECGCGFSTKYFMDHCDRVVSIEFMCTGTGDLWYKECLRLFDDCTNWKPLLYNADLKDESFNKACGYACSVHRDYSLIDPTYLLSLDRYFKNEIEEARREGIDVDVAFVDPGVYTRGDMVKVLLQNKVPVVVAHDTCCDLGSDVDEGYYDWFVVKTPPDYEKIFIRYGMCTTFWISKNMPDLIRTMKRYRDLVITEGGASSITEIVEQL